MEWGGKESAPMLIWETRWKGWNSYRQNNGLVYLGKDIPTILSDVGLVCRIFWVEASTNLHGWVNPSDARVLPCNSLCLPLRMPLATSLSHPHAPPVGHPFAATFWTCHVAISIVPPKATAPFRGLIAWVQACSCLSLHSPAATDATLQCHVAIAPSLPSPPPPLCG